MSDDDSLRWTYAWNWFSMHAGQRLQMVNFWLVATAFLAAAFVQAWQGNFKFVAAGVAAIGAVASLAFMGLDARTRTLCLIGERALETVEDGLSARLGDPTVRLVASANASRASVLDSYRVLIQGLQAVGFTTFLVAGVYSILG